jgi:hypothetical protein
MEDRIENPTDKESITFLVYPEPGGRDWMRYEVRYPDVMKHTGWKRWALAMLAVVAKVLGYKGSYSEYERVV